MPALDAIVESLPKKCKNILFISIFLITVCQKLIYGNDFLELGHGYSAIWLAILYCVGAYIKKYNPLSNYSNKKLLFLSVLMSFISWLWQLLCRLLFCGYEKMSVLQYFIYSRHTTLISYLSITMILQATFMVIIFSRINIKQKITSIIKTLSPLSFSVYIIHTTSLVFDYVNVPLGKFVAQLATPIKPILFIVFDLIECCCCLLMDYLRNTIFNKLKIVYRISAIENGIANIIAK